MLRDLPLLETISFVGTRITDAGAANLAHCHELQEVALGWTRTGDATLRALAGKTKLRVLRTGHAVTDDGLALLHELPVFKTWQGGTETMALLSYDAGPNYLLLRGTFTDRGMQLRGLDGLFALNLDGGGLRVTADAMKPLVPLSRLGWLAVPAKGDWMPHIASLGAQWSMVSAPAEPPVSAPGTLGLRSCRRLGHQRPRGCPLTSNRDRA